MAYRRIATLRDYVRVSPETQRLEHFQLQDDGTWRFALAGPGESITLQMSARIAVEDVYAGVTLLPARKHPGVRMIPAPE